MSADRITLRGMRFLGRHGVTLEERMEPQPIEVDIVMWADLRAAAGSDQLRATVDYAAVFSEARRVVEESSFRLLEALAAAISDAVLGSQPSLTGVDVAVRKPNAPLPGSFEHVEVRLHRDRAQPTDRD